MKSNDFNGFLHAGLGFLGRHKYYLMIFLLATFLLLGLNVVYRGALHVPHRTDLTVFLRASNALQNGENLYAVHNERNWNYVYFPLLAILLTPLANCPLVFSVALWYSLSVAAMCGTVILSAKLSNDSIDGFLLSIKSLLLSPPFFFDALTRGQTGIIIVFLMMLIFFLYRRNQALWAGLALAFGISLKFTPIIILGLYFVIKRQWKVCLGLGIGLLFFLGIFPSFVLGAHHNAALLKEYFQILYGAVNDVEHKERLWAQLVTPFALHNQSLYAVLTRIVGQTEPFLMNHSNHLIHLVVNAFGILNLLFISIMIRAKKSVNENKDALLEYSLFPILMLFVAPVAEMQHYTVLYALFLAGCMQLREMDSNSPFHHVLETFLWIASGGFILGYLWNPMGFYGAPLWGSLFLFLILLSKLFFSKVQLKWTGKILLIFWCTAGSLAFFQTNAFSAQQSVPKPSLPVFRGVSHVHTEFSHDSTASLDFVVEKAKENDLDFVIVTDHNSMKGKKAYEKMKHPDHPLMIFGEEISTRDGHLISLGTGRHLSKELPSQVLIDKIHARGGYAILAHPFMPKKPWTNWEVHGWDGFEVCNGADAFAADPVDLVVRSFYEKPKKILNPMQKIPEKNFSFWDDHLKERPIIAVGGSDAHLRDSAKNFTIALQFVTLYALAEQLNEKEIVKAVGSGKVFMVFETRGKAPDFSFWAESQDKTFVMGETLQPAAEISFHVHLPASAKIQLVRDGSIVADEEAQDLVFPTREPGAYRVEVYRDGDLWIFSNPIYLRI